MDSKKGISFDLETYDKTLPSNLVYTRYFLDIITNKEMSFAEKVSELTFLEKDLYLGVI